MKKWFWILLVSVVVVKLPAQTNAPVQLALIAESDETTTAADVLTAQLSANQNIQLLERDEIEKVYNEQGMSAANRDDLKLGRILGADGLLLLDIVRTPLATNLTARLIAVKPGVVLTDGSFPWPLKDSVQWAQSITTYLDTFLPKLSLLAKDAIPISIVNLRAAVSSVDEQQTEHDLKRLTIQRLSQERQLFVLERQKMQLLSEEKELKSDESAFWNGSYLLDGTVDQNGYSQETVTINARLTPPKGGAPLPFEVSGSRTNLLEVINRLAAKVTELLNVNSTVQEWSTTNEAAQYYDEAKWALRWGVYSEAQAAAESAWALGKKDLDCASVRVEAYVDEIPSKTTPFEEGSMSYDPGTENLEEADMKEISATNAATMFNRAGNTIQYVAFSQLPDPHNIDRAIYALNLYYQFSLNSSGDLLKVASGASHWKNSAWYDLGIQDLVAASMVLQDFNIARKAQIPVADKLSELRALTRSVAGWTARSPAVHDSYFVGNRVAVYDELAYTIGDEGGYNSNIFSCEAEWGCFWQEKPEDTIAFCRQLMSSPVFCYIHEKFWFPGFYSYRRLPLPRLVAWNDEDQKRIPAIWNDFIQELGASTNLLLQLEAKALKLADSDGGPAMAESFTNLFETMFKNRDALIANNVDILYLGWNTGDLVERMGGESASSTRDPLQRVYYSVYRPKLEAMEQEYRSKTVPALKFLAVFNEQVRYLQDNTPYDFFKFANLFNGVGGNNYSESQAREILPLLATYKSNLVAQSKSASGMQKGQLMSAIAQVGFVENDINRILQSSTSQPTKVEAATIINPAPVPAAHPRVVPQTLKESTDVVTNVLLVEDCFKIPYDRLQNDNGNISGFQIFAQRWNGGKFMAGVQYGEEVYEFDQQGNWKSTSTKPHLAIAIFNPDTKSWNMVNCPDISDMALIGLRNPYSPDQNNHMALFQDCLYFNGERPLQKYDFQKREWQNLDIPAQSGCDLFTVAGHLFATDANSILEITNGGQGVSILASTRRRPGQSALDSMDNLGFASAFAGGAPSPPELFSGPDSSVCANIGNRVFSWDGKDWHELFVLNFSQPPEVFETSVVFRSIPSFGSDGLGSLWIWDELQSQPQLALYDNAKPHPGIINESPSGFSNPMHQSIDQTAHPLWKSPPDDFLTGSAVTFYQTNFYFFVDHCIVTNVSGQWTVAEKNGYHAQLVCLSQDVSEPIIVPLKFNLDRGQPPLKSLAEKFEQIPWNTGSSWIHFAGDALYIGQPDTPDIWIIPVTEIEIAVAEQKKVCLARMMQDKKQALAAEEQQHKVSEQQHKDLLAKYDLNHNGVIDPEEREAALDDPAFIESELDAIDTNHNGLLDPEELAYFDPDNNKILEPKEQAGIGIAEHLFAERLMKKFDANGDGILDRDEFNNLWQSCGFGNNTRGFVPFSAFSLADENHDGQVDLKELESFLKQQLRQELRPRGAAGAAFFRQLTADPNTAIDPGHIFKAEVEFYWRNSANPVRRKANVDFPWVCSLIFIKGFAVANGHNYWK